MKLDKSDILLALTRLAIIRNESPFQSSFGVTDSALLADLINEIMVDKENQHILSNMPSHSISLEDI